MGPKIPRVTAQSSAARYRPHLGEISGTISPGADPARCRAFEDGEAGLASAHTPPAATRLVGNAPLISSFEEQAHAAGCHVVDVTSMAGYPSCDGLRRAKQAAEASRAWLSPPGAAAVPP